MFNDAMLWCSHCSMFDLICGYWDIHKPIFSEQAFPRSMPNAFTCSQNSDQFEFWVLHYFPFTKSRFKNMSSHLLDDLAIPFHYIGSNDLDLFIRQLVWRSHDSQSWQARMMCSWKNRMLLNWGYIRIIIYIYIHTHLLVSLGEFSWLC